MGLPHCEHFRVLSITVVTLFMQTAGGEKGKRKMEGRGWAEDEGGGGGGEGDEEKTAGFSPPYSCTCSPRVTHHESTMCIWRAIT